MKELTFPCSASQLIKDFDYLEKQRQLREAGLDL